MSDRPRLSDDDRYELASRAEARARANRPGHLVALGALGVIVGLLVAAFAWRADAGSARRLDQAASDVATLRTQAERLAELRTQMATSSGEDRYRDIPDILSRLGNLAREAGLESVPSVPRQTNDAMTNARRVNYLYENVRDGSLEDLVRWAELATERIPGMHVRSITIRPQPDAWSMNVTFARFERLD